MTVPVSGGGYFRLYPYRLSAYLLEAGELRVRTVRVLHASVGDRSGSAAHSYVVQIEAAPLHQSGSFRNEAARVAARLRIHVDGESRCRLSGRVVAREPPRSNGFLTYTSPTSNARRSDHSSSHRRTVWTSVRPSPAVQQLPLSRRHRERAIGRPDVLAAARNTGTCCRRTKAEHTPSMRK